MGEITLNWPQLRLLATIALPVIMASCVPVKAATDPAKELAADVSPIASQASVPLDPGVREQFSRRVAELLTPVSAEPAAPFAETEQSADDRTRSLDCLTSAIYYEARSEPEEGQRAVAQVVLNRVRHPAYPSNVCGVVFQGSHRRTGCQFSFTCDGSMRGIRQPSAWERARRYAAEALAGYVFAPVGNATHYHTTAILPYWAKHLRKSAIVGAHIFYRWSGSAGEASAFRQRYGGLEPAPALIAQAEQPGTGVEVHRGKPRFWREIVDVGAANVTIHRGPVALPAQAEKQAEEQAEEQGPDQSEQFGVRVHRGSVPAAS
jgi:spore germination cell wall hydrolase CwlJ-like protein